MWAEDTQRGWGMRRARPPARPRPVPSLEFPETGEVWLFRTVISSRLQLLWEESERARERRREETGRRMKVAFEGAAPPCCGDYPG